MPRAFLCDFDGTVSPSDIGADFARRFSPGGAAEGPDFLARWRRGEMGHRELTVAQCAQLAVTREQALAFARGFALDPYFAPFVREVRARGDAVIVVSEGFDFYVRDLLERAGLGELPWSANEAIFEYGRVTPVFPHGADGCGRCGNCKGAHVRAWRARGYETVLVGDGLSDRCGARAADGVLARRDLLAWCRREGIEATPFETFADVHRLFASGSGTQPGVGPGAGPAAGPVTRPEARPGGGSSGTLASASCSGSFLLGELRRPWLPLACARPLAPPPGHAPGRLALSRQVRPFVAPARLRAAARAALRACP